MADNVSITAGNGTSVATDDVSSVHYQKVKIALGADGAVDTLLDSGQQAMENSVPVTLASDQTAVPVDSELPAAGALADATATPTTSTIGSFPFVRDRNAGAWNFQTQVHNGLDSVGTGIPSAGLMGHFDNVSPSSVTENRFAPLRMSALRGLHATSKPDTLGGYLVARDVDLDEDTAANIKASAGQVYGWYIFNAASATRFVKLYDKATSPTVGTDAPKLTIPVPAGGGTNVEFGNGIEFTNGIGWAATTGVADNDTGAPGANEVIANLLYF